MDDITSLADNFTLWQPPKGHAVRTGAELTEFLLPVIPLPVLTAVLEDGAPSDDALGTGLYDYLRQFPGCPYNVEYAVLLRDAWPHFIADLSSMILMLDHKDVDAPYIRRKITGMQILLLLNPDNPGLLLQLGIACYDLSMNYIELCNCRSHLTKAINYFSAANKAAPNEPTNLNYMAQIDYLTGDYPKAIERMHALTELVQDEETKSSIFARIEVLNGQELPEKPLLSDLESVGEAMRLLASGAPEEANCILERLDREQIITTEFPSPEFFSLLAISRERSGELSGAQAAFARALELDPSHQESLNGVDRLLQGGN